MFWIKNSPLWAPDGEGDGGGAVDTSVTMYPDDQPAADSAADVVPEKETDGNVPAPADTEKPTLDPKDAPKTEDNADAGEWKPYEDDPAKTPEENAAARAENDAKHPINQVPEDGKYQLTMPDGVELDQGLLDALGPTMAELKLSNGHAQMLVDKYIEQQQASATQRQEDWAKTIQGWADDAQKDPEMGGAKWDATKAAALSAVTRFGTPELKNYLEVSGAGNHPEIIRLMAKVGAMIGEDVPAVSDQPGKGASQDTASRMYPDDQPKG